jgi:hypothetical protein
MCVEYYQSMNNRVALETPGEEILSSVNGQSLVVCGVVSVPVRVGGTRLQPCVRFFVVKGLATPMLVLLGLEFILEHIQATSWSESTFSLKVAPTVNLILFRSSVLVGPQNRVTFGKGRDLPSVSTNPPVVKPVPVVLIRTIIVRPGAANGNADALSRLPALLENFENNQAKSHRLISVVTRTKTNSLPPVHRATRGLDTEFVLNGRAYDTAEAIRQSLLGY